MTQTVTLSTGTKMPQLGLGTWKSPPEQTKASVIAALPPAYMRPEMVERAFNKSLTRLKLKYVDLYLIHNPMPAQNQGDNWKGREGIPMVDPEHGDMRVVVDPDFTDFTLTWKAMEELYKSGRARAIGLSNFNSKQIQHILSMCAVRPHNLQVECHAMFHQRQLHDFCKRNAISFTAYAPIGSPTMRALSGNQLPSLLEHPTVTEIARRYCKTPAQILLRWLIQRDIVVIPKSDNEARIKSNVNVWGFYLDEEDMNALWQLPQKRLFTLLASPSNLGYTSDNSNYPFSEEF